jgi:uncharacterized delta-60 repeat protein
MALTTVRSFFSTVIWLLLWTSLSIAHAKPGDLDPSFGSGGIVISSFGGQNMFGPAVLVQSDRKIVVVGKTFNGHDDDILVQRFNSDGSPDAAFGTAGATIVKLSTNDDNAKALAFQSDGKIIVAGGAGQPGSYETSALLRVTADGVLDTSFGTGGKALIDFGLPSHSHSVVVQSDGKIVVTGETYTSADGGLFATARVLASGALDTTFGTGGKMTHALGTGANAHSMALQPDGKLLIGGYATSADTGRPGFVVARFLSNGTLDTSFGTNGFSTASVGTGNNYCHGLMLQLDGKIVLTGSAVTATNYDFSLVRFNSDGLLDTTFGNSGIVTTNFALSPRASVDETAAGVIQADGKIIVGGYSERKFALARYLSSGALDSSFGTGGLVTNTIGTSNDDWMKSLALQSWDGNIVAVGYSKNGSSFNLSMARYAGDSVSMVCTLSAFPVSVAVGMSSTLTANCSPSATAYAWTGTGFGDSVSGGAIKPTATTTYTVVGSNASSSSSPATATVTVSNEFASPVYRFANPITGGHFFTSIESERDYVQANLPAFGYEGIGFYAFATKLTSSLPVYRFSNAKGFHYFTISELEKTALMADTAYVYDGIAYYGYASPTAGSSPVYRFKNSVSGASFYTASLDEYNFILSHYPAYVYQSVSFYVKTGP